jgi:hypothetical protein
MKVEQFTWIEPEGWDRPLLSSGLSTSAQLVVLFGDAKLAASEACRSEVHQAFPNACVFGCSTAGEILGVRVRNGTLALTAIMFEHSRVATARVTVENPEGSFTAGQEVVRGLDPVGLRHVFVVSEGLRVYSTDVVGGIRNALPPGVTVSGGFAADYNILRATHVWCDSEPQQSTVIALGFYGEKLHFGLSVTGGWHPFGPDRIITRSHRNILYEFDGRPALALYKKYLGEHAAGLPATGHLFPLELQHRERKSRVLRALLAVDEKEQSITYAGDVPEGSCARFMMGKIEDLISGALKAAKASLECMSNLRPDLSLLVSCSARRPILLQRVEEEVEVVRDVLGEHTAMTGFYSYGEIGPPSVGAPSELHNETMSITNITEA